MKNIVSLLLLWLCATAVYAQSPAPEPDTVIDVVNQGDPAVSHLPPPQTNYVKGMKRIVPEELPAPVRKTLESSAQYSDWEKALIYENKTKDEYVVQFKDADKTISYRFDKNGLQVKD